MYKTFKDFTNSLNEGFDNVFVDSEKLKYVDQVWDLLQAAYESQGGLHGNGFGSKEEMIKKIPFWKIGKTNGKVVAVSMYKDKGGRKKVALGTDGSFEGKARITEMLGDDIVKGRAYIEMSGRVLSFLHKIVPNIAKYANTPDVVKVKLVGDEIRDCPSDDPEIKLHPDLKDFFYQRIIGGSWHTKIMLGNIHSEPITNY